MKRFIPILSLAVAAILPVACSTSTPLQKQSTRTTWDLPLDAVPASNRVEPKTVQALAQPLTVPDVEAKVGPYLARLHGMTGEKVRSFSIKAGDLRNRGELLADIDDRHPDLIVVEHKGNFTSHMKGEQRGETFPYAMLVVDSRTGELVSRILYAERYRPQ